MQVRSKQRQLHTTTMVVTEIQMSLVAFNSVHTVYILIVLVYCSTYYIWQMVTIQLYIHLGLSIKVVAIFMV